MIDFTDYDVIHGDCIYTEVSKEKKKSTPVTTENIMISTQSDLTEFYSYESGYFNPSDAVKRLIQSANGSNVKVYDGGVMMTLGDSYTAYMNTFYDSFAKKHGLVQDNRGVASSTIAGDTGGNIGFKPFWNRLDSAILEYEAGLTIDKVTYSADDVKLIVFMGGANDWSTVNDTIDRLGKGAFETDKGKLYGALNHIFATLLSTFKNADVVVTGEGRLDAQTVMGKAPVGVAALAKKYNAKVIAFAGSVAPEASVCNQAGIDAFFPIVRGVTTLEEAMKKENAMENIAATAEQVFRLL